MRLITAFLTILYLLSSDSLANDSHHAGAAIQYHVDQTSMPGFSAFYQWQFQESLLLEANYIDSNNITVDKNQHSVSGNYSQFLLGANFLKQYNNNLLMVAGGGFSYVLTSSNSLLIKEQQIAPYLKLAANYTIDDKFSVELGQFTHFQGNELSTNHAVYLSVNYRFSNKFSYINKNHNEKVVSSAKQNPQSVNQPSVTAMNMKKTTFSSIKKSLSAIELNSELESDNGVNSATKLNSVDIESPVHKQNNNAAPFTSPHQSIVQGWYVQLGAYSTLSNAQKALNKITKEITKIRLLLVKNTGFFRVVSQAFSTNQLATAHLKFIKTSYNIEAFVTQMNKDNTEYYSQ